MKTDRTIISLLAGSIMLTILSAIITHYAVQDSRNRVQWVFHTYTVIEKANELLSLVKDAETAQRGFVITNDSSYLEPFLTATIKLPAQADSIRWLVSDNEKQTRLFNDEILPVIEVKLNVMTQSLNAYRQNREHGIEIIKKGVGKVTMDSLRQLLLVFGNNEQALLQQRLDQLAETHQRQILLRNISFSAIAVISLLALLTITQKQKQNNELIGKLQVANETLEQRVTERTAELLRQKGLIEELNEELRQNMEEMESFYEALQTRNANAEDKLKEISDLYNYAPCGYHSLDMNGIIIRMNKTELDWLGYTADEVVGKMPITKIVAPEEHEAYYEGFSAFKRSGFIRNVKHNFIRKDGSSFPILLNATAIYDEEGQYILSRGTVTDMTEMTKVEQKLIQANQNLIHLNEEKNHFLGIAAHDLKSPLNSVLGLINLVEVDKQNLTSKQTDYLAYMQQSCISMQTLINNLLDVNRIEQGLQENNAEEIEIHELLNRHIHVFGEVAKMKDITLILENQAPGAKINCDPMVLQRIVDNLVSNALKFSRPKGKVILRAAANGTLLKIEVVDTGQGIRADEISKLFKKFQRLSSRPTNGESSTGLGLFIVKELVHVLHGKIYVESEVNKGSKFTVELPLNK